MIGGVKHEFLNVYQNSCFEIIYTSIIPVRCTYYWWREEECGSFFITNFFNFFNNYVINANNDGIGFNFNPVFPQATLGQANKYWYNTTNSYVTTIGQSVPVVVGIDDSPLNGLLNSIGVPTLTFELQLLEYQVRDIYYYMLNNNISSITDNIIIYNNDIKTVPLTTFYGPNGNYQNISTTIPITISF